MKGIGVLLGAELVPAGKVGSILFLGGLPPGPTDDFANSALNALRLDSIPGREIAGS